MTGDQGMAGFSSTDVALEGFRVTRERPTAILAWAGLSLVVSLLTTLAMVSMAGPQFAALMSMNGSKPDVAAMMAIFSRLAPAYSVTALIWLAYNALMYAAANRAVLRPGERLTGYLRLGVDELLQLVVMILLGLIFLGVYIGLVIVIGLLSWAVDVAYKPAASAVAVIGFIALLCALIWLAVRLSLASAATFDTRQIGIGASWRMTRGRFWPLLGAYVIAVVLVVVIWLLGLIILFAIAAAVGGGLTAAGELLHPNFGSLAAYFTPVMIVNLAVGALLTALGLAIFICAQAEAYRQLRATKAAGVAGGRTSV